ncbi:MAG: Hpt domain-containing protein [Spirochaetia bacterium]
MSLRKELVGLFRQEAEDLLSQTEELILAAKKDPVEQQIDRVGEIFRFIHSLKAAVHGLGLDDYTKLLHACEEWILKYKNSIRHDDTIDYALLLELIDYLSAAFEGNRLYSLYHPERFYSLLKRFEKEKRPEESVEPKKEQEDVLRHFKIELQLVQDILHYGHRPLRLFRHLARKGQLLDVRCSFSDLPVFTEIEPTKLYVTWKLKYATRLPLDQLSRIFEILPEGCVVKLRAGSDKKSNNRQRGSHVLECAVKASALVQRVRRFLNDDTPQRLLIEKDLSQVAELLEEISADAGKGHSKSAGKDEFEAVLFRAGKFRVALPAEKVEKIERRRHKKTLSGLTVDPFHVLERKGDNSVSTAEVKSSGGMVTYVFESMIGRQKVTILRTRKIPHPHIFSYAVLLENSQIAYLLQEADAFSSQDTGE